MNVFLSGGPAWNVEGFYVLDVLVLFFALWWFMRKPLAKFIRERRERVMADIDEAQRLREEAETKLQEYEERLEHLEEEVQSILDEARAAGEAQRKQILLSANKAAERIRSDAKVRLEQEARKLEHELRTRMVQLSVGIAEGLVQEKITDAHRGKFVTDYIAELDNWQGEL